MTTIGRGPNAPALLPSAVMISSSPKSRLAIPAQIDVADLYLKEASGERDYDHYRAWAERAGLTPISRDDFFLSQIEARYSRPNRCCRSVFERGLRRKGL